MMKPVLEEANAGWSRFYGGSNMLYYGFTTFRGTVCTVECRVSRFNCCMFCEVRLSLASFNCQYCSSVPSYLVPSGP